LALREIAAAVTLTLGALAHRRERDSRWVRASIVSAPRQGGSLMANIAAIVPEIQRIHGEYYGQTPGQVRVYEAGDVVVVLIEETFTRAEQVLIGRGEADEVQVIRAIVQSATGRCVRVFLSDTDLREHLAVETFVLGEPIEDMAAFEREEARSDTAQEISDQFERERAFEPPET
jgi:uncharacterized protein YbcI